MAYDASRPITRDNLPEGEFGLHRKMALTKISDYTVPPGTVFDTPEGLKAEDEDARVAVDVQGGIYPIRENVYRASYEPVEPKEWCDETVHRS